MNIGHIGRSRFWDKEEVRHWNWGPDRTPQVKLLAKMFRELTHIKPPRGRQGRLLDQESHLAVELEGAAGEGSSYNATQGVFTLEDEMTRIENRSGLSFYTMRGTFYNEPKERDLERLQKYHQLHQSKLKVENTVNSLSDLIQGLMGLGLKNVQYEVSGYRRDEYYATMELQDFEITITQKQ